jgi:hypothetical protein
MEIQKICYCRVTASIINWVIKRLTSAVTSPHAKSTIKLSVINWYDILNNYGVGGHGK